MAEERIKQIFQVVCVVTDLEETLENWKTMVEFDRDSIKLGRQDETARYIYKGKEIECDLRTARFDLGGIDMMLAEPRNKQGNDPYADCLREKGPGFHHLGVYTEDYDGFVSHLANIGVKPIFEVTTATGEGYVLYDLNEEVGMSVVPFDHLFGPCGKAVKK